MINSDYCLLKGLDDEKLEAINEDAYAGLTGDQTKKLGADFINDLSEGALDALGEGEDAFRGIGEEFYKLDDSIIEGIMQ